MRDITHIIIHCSATPPDMDIGVEDIDRWHRSRGWDGCGYHWVVRRDGDIEKGRPVEQVGAHTSGWNDHSIGICWVGGVNDDREPEDNRTDEQKTALHAMVAGRGYRHGVPIANIIGHRETGARKACPSFDVQELRDALEARAVTADASIFERVEGEAEKPDLTIANAAGLQPPAKSAFPLRLVIHADGTVETL